MSGRRRRPTALREGPSRKCRRKQPKHDDPQRVPRTTSDEDAGVERFMPEAFGPLPGYEHAHRYLAASLIFGKGRILDLASGSGVGTAALRAAGAQDEALRRGGRRQIGDRARGWLQVVGLDLDLASARRAAPAVQGDAVRLPFADASFDGVICFEAIEHLEEPPRLLEEIRRVLRLNGVVLLSTPNRDVFTARAGRSNPFHVSEMNPEELLEVLGASFPHTALYSQSVWAGSWLAELGEGGAPAPEMASRRWRVASQDLAPVGDAAPAPWADREDTHPPCPLYLVAVCSSSAKAFERARRVLGANHLLHDRAQWLLGHYMASLGGLAERDTLIESHAMHGRNLQKRIDESSERVRSLETHATNLETERAPLLVQIQALEEHAANAAALESRVQSRILKLIEHADNLAAELARVGERADAAFDHAANLEAERSTLERRTTDFEAHARNLEIELEAQSAHTTNLEAERSTLERRTTDFEAHARNLEIELEAQSAHTTNLEAERSTLEWRTTDIEAHARNLEIELEAQSAHTINLEAERSTLERRTTDIEAHARNLEIELEAQSAHTINLEAALIAERGRINALFERTESLSKEVDTWRERADSARRGLAEMRASHTVRFVTWLRTLLRR